MRKHDLQALKNMDHRRNSRQFDRMSMGTKNEQFDMQELILTKNRRFCAPPPRVRHPCSAFCSLSWLFLAEGGLPTRAPCQLTAPERGGAKGTKEQNVYPTSTPSAPIKGEGGTNI